MSGAAAPAGENLSVPPAAENVPVFRLLGAARPLSARPISSKAGIPGQWSPKCADASAPASAPQGFENLSTYSSPQNRGTSQAIL